VNQIKFLFSVSIRKKLENYEFWANMLGGSSEDGTDSINTPTPIKGKRKYKFNHDKYKTVVDIDTPNIDDLRRGIGQLYFTGGVGERIP